MAYTSQATVSIPAASGSTQTNISLVITGTDTKLKTVANGGQIQNTVTRVGQTVPADLILSSDAAGTLLYNWGWDFYDPVNGIATIWLLMPSHSSSSSTTIYITIGNAAVTTYQGGSQGAEFDSTFLGVYHLSDGTSLGVKDFTSLSNDGTTHNTPTATTGKIDGAASLVSGSSQYISTANLNNPTHATISGWVKLAAYPAGTGASAGFLFGLLNGIASSTNERNMIIDSTGSVTWYVFDGGGKTIISPSALSLNVWHYLVGVNDGTNMMLYIDGSLISSIAAGNGFTGYTVPNFYITGNCNNNPGGTYCTYLADEVRFSNAGRTANWVATEYTNQNTIPTMGTFNSLSTAYTKSFADPYTLAEVFFKRTNRSVSETYTLAETFGRRITISPSEVFSLAESFTKVPPMGHVNLRDAIQILDFFKVSLLRDPSLFYYRQYMLDLSGIAAPTQSPSVSSSGPSDPSLDFFRRYLGRI